MARRWHHIQAGEGPSLTVLIATYNEVAWIGPCLQALHAALTTLGLTAEILVCDGASEDGTAEVVARYGFARWLVCPQKGRAAQYNAGLAEARGAWVMLLHADCLATPGLFREFAQAAGHEDVVGGWSQIEILVAKGELASANLLGPMAFGINLRTRLFHTATGDQAIFARRDVLQKVGGIPLLPLMECNALVRELRGRGKTVVLGPHLRISGRRWEQGGTLSTMLRMYAIRLGYMLGVHPGHLVRWWR